METTTIQDLRSVLTQQLDFPHTFVSCEEELDDPTQTAFESIRTSLDFEKIIKPTPFKKVFLTINCVGSTSPKSPLTTKYLLEPDSPVSPGLEEDNTLQSSFADTSMSFSTDFPRGILKKQNKSRFSTEIREGSPMHKAINEAVKAVTLKIQVTPKNRHSSFRKKQTCVLNNKKYQK